MRVGLRRQFQPYIVKCGGCGSELIVTGKEVDEASELGYFSCPLCSTKFTTAASELDNLNEYLLKIESCEDFFNL